MTVITETGRLQFVPTPEASIVEVVAAQIERQANVIAEVTGDKLQEPDSALLAWAPSIRSINDAITALEEARSGIYRNLGATHTL